ncbi:monocarboxylate transporter 10-like isoform X2 [Patiria miniata]|uniref:Major facilitator superfamily (MFS) profile domain-containing protein n=1 Tax=Patiria miniata TaxID=46514 RepID=A0A913ZBX5_PATMI|nr:monocarboxylate transporter 10-like isoform X2 [Patiria miniata]
MWAVIVPTTQVQGWVGSLGSALLCCISPLVAVIAWKIGTARVVFLGTILTAAGYLATSFISSLAQGYLTFSLMAGIGAGFMNCGSVNLLLEWFIGQSNACRSTAAASTGTSVGVMVFGPLLNTLTASYGWRNCFRILSGIMLTLGLLTALPFLKPPEKRKGQQADETDVKVETPPRDKAEQSGESHEDPRQGVTDLKTCGGLDSEDPDRKKRSRMKFFCEMVLNVEVWLWVSAITMAQLGWSFVIINYTSFLEGLELSTENISLALTVSGAAEVSGKIVIAIIGDRLPFLKLYVSVVALIVAAMVSGFLTLCSTFWSIIVMSIVWGYCRGTIFGVAMAAALELFKMYGPGAVAAICLLGFGTGVLIGSPITGVFYDQTGSYTLSLFAVVASFGLSTLCTVLIPIKRKFATRCCRKASENTENNSADEAKVDPAVPIVETRSVGISNPAYEIEMYSVKSNAK